MFVAPTGDLHLVARHKQMFPILRDPERFSSAFGAVGDQGADDPEVAAVLAEGWPYLPTMLTCDPPAHTRYRGTVADYFRPARIEALRPAIVEIAGRLIRALPEGESFDVVPALAVPLPVEVIAAVLQLPEDRMADFKRWSDDAVAGTGAHPDAEHRLAAARGVVELQRFLAGELEDRRERPRGDLMSDLVQAEIESGDPGSAPRLLTMAEMVSIVRQLLVAGNETTTNVIVEGVRLLASDPDQWGRLRADPDGRAGAVAEEVIRLASPLAGMFRVATDDTEIDGCPIPRGARVFPLYAAANRDPEVWGDHPDAFDPDRPNIRKHFGFGRGIHFCIGAPLARLELSTTFAELARRIERIELASDDAPHRHPSFVHRGLTRLEVRAFRAAD